jgi:uncharacterized membrane protein
MKNKTFSGISMVLSVVAVILALMDALSVSVWLSASSWLLVAIIFGIWALYTEEK